MRPTRALLLAASTAASIAATPLQAQAAKPLFTARDAALAGGFAALTVAMLPLDHYLARHVNDSASHTNRLVNRAATGFEIVATPGSFFIGGALYAFGRIAKHPDVADLGWHGTEAIVIASATTSVLKGVLGRARPYATADTNPTDFKLLGGFSGRSRQSFPSGHATTAFAAASAVTAEVSRMWPAYTWIVGPALYTGATAVGISRMYHDQHWASDVALGAAIGTFAGIKIVRYTRSHPGNGLDQSLLGKRNSRFTVPIGWSVSLP
jgi:membrane-associated phospholipid phosphatase